MRLSIRAFIALVSCSFFLLFCKNDTPSGKKNSPAPKDGHTRMIAILDSIADYADP